VDLLAAIDDFQPPPELLRTPVRANDDREPRWVHELDTAEVDDHVLRTGLPGVLTYKASLGDVVPDDPVFPTRNETFRDKDNINHRVIGPVERAARTLRAERGLAPVPTGLSAHAFRRTYITLMAEAGAPITYVQDQVGHESARLTLEIYARVSRSRDRSKWGRAFDEIMAGAVPPKAYEAVEQVALFAVDDQTTTVDRGRASATGGES
jgi:Phage integrase family